MSIHATSRWRRLGLLAFGILAAAALVAGACNDEDDNDVDDTPTAPVAETPVDAAPTDTPEAAAETPEDAATPEAEDTTLGIADHPEHGQILTDADGFALYTFEVDVPGSGESACNDNCATLWPPLTVDDEPTAPAGATGELATIQRADGSTQVTYNGAPLYRYAQDEAPGDANGHLVGGVWFVATP